MVNFRILALLEERKIREGIMEIINKSVKEGRMKRVLMVTVAILGCGIAYASDGSYNKMIANEPGLSVNKNYTIDTVAQPIDYLSIQAVYSSDTWNADIFTDGQRSTGTITFSTTTGMANGGYVTIGGYAFSASSNTTIWGDFDNITTTSMALSLNNAINTRMGWVITSTISLTGATMVIYTTSNYCGSAYNFPMTASSTTFQLGTSSSMTGGINPTINYFSSTISSQNAKVPYTLGLPVRYTTTSGVAPAPLVAGVTYYVLPISTSSFYLSATSTDTVAGKHLSFKENASSGGSVLTLTPLAINGTCYILLQGSNDNIDFANINSATTTITINENAPQTASGNYLWDLGFVTYRYIRASVTSVTAGAMNIVIWVEGKKVQ